MFSHSLMFLLQFIFKSPLLLHVGVIQELPQTYPEMPLSVLTLNEPVYNMSLRRLHTQRNNTTKSDYETPFSVSLLLL